MKIESKMKMAEVVHRFEPGCPYVTAFDIIKRGTHNVYDRQIRMTRHDEYDAEIMLLLTLISEYKFITFGGDEMMWIYQWGRDCDQFEADSISQIPATLEAFREAEEQMYDGAEGPCSIYIISQQEAAEYSPRRIDHAAIQMGY